jgi:hypothetical protein
MLPLISSQILSTFFALRIGYAALSQADLSRPAVPTPERVVVDQRLRNGRRPPFTAKPSISVTSAPLFTTAGVR